MNSRITFSCPNAVPDPDVNGPVTGGSGGGGVGMVSQGGGSKGRVPGGA